LLNSTTSSSSIYLLKTDIPKHPSSVDLLTISTAIPTHALLLQPSSHHQRKMAVPPLVSLALFNASGGQIRACLILHSRRESLPPRSTSTLLQIAVKGCAAGERLITLVNYIATATSALLWSDENVLTSPSVDLLGPSPGWKTPLTRTPSRELDRCHYDLAPGVESEIE